MRKFLSISILLCLVLIIAVAGHTSDSFKVGYFSPGVFNDGSYNTLGYNAIMGAKREMGFELIASEAVPHAQVPRVLAEYASAGVDVVWAHSGTFMDPVLNEAPFFPEVSFVTYAGLPQDDAPDNVWQQINLMAHRQLFFLSGVLSALMTESNVVGFVGGVELTTYAEGMKSFEVGAKWINPDIRVLKTWTGNFDDAARAREAATGQIEQGADVISHAVNLGVFGVAEAVRAHEDVYFIGKDTDQSALLPDRHLMSKYVDYSYCMNLIFNKIKEGQRGGVFITELGTGAETTELALFVPPEIVERYNAIKDMVENYEFDAGKPAEELEREIADIPVP